MAFCPGPGIPGLFQFTRMLFGLCDAVSSFQQLMARSCEDCRLLLPIRMTYSSIQEMKKPTNVICNKFLNSLLKPD